MITLAVPVYNMEQYLARCMDTLLAQTCGDYEILLIDDGSRDAGGALCDAYASAHPELVRVVHKENGGLSSARNAGIENARGEFIIFPDPDDWVEKDYVHRLLTLQKEYSADLVCTGHYVDDTQTCVPALAGCPLRRMTGSEAREALLLVPQMNGFAWNKLYRLDIIREHDLRFGDDVGTTEDLDFTHRYLKLCENVCHDPNSRTYHYFQRPGAATHSAFSLRQLDSIRTYERIAADCEAQLPELAKAAREEICVTAVNLLWAYENARMQAPEVKKTLLGHIRRNLGIHMRSGRYGLGRKLQALTAAVSPKIFTKLKNTARGA